MNAGAVDWFGGKLTGRQHEDAEVRRALFVELRRRWTEAGHGNINELARRLGIRKQNVSAISTGCDEKSPAWWAIARLCEDLRLAVVLAPDGARIVRVRHGRVANAKVGAT